MKNQFPKSSTVILDDSGLELAYNHDTTFNVAMSGHDSMVVTRMDEKEAEVLWTYLNQFFA